MHNQIRQPAVAGMFYPRDANELASMLTDMLQTAASQLTDPTPAPKAIIVPHAGYVYSGPVAASAYARIVPRSQQVRRVILLGPSHRVPLIGLAASSASHFATPLGQVELDRDAIEQALALPQVKLLDQAHSMEHSLEVHLPFLQTVLSDFTLVPLVVGEASAQEVAEVLELLWGGDETLIVISSDLSHYLPSAIARQQDAATTRAIESLQFEQLEYEDACGRNPIRGLLYYARQHGRTVTTIDLRNSGDTAGPEDHVVGYGAYVMQ